MKERALVGHHLGVRNELFYAKSKEHCSSGNYIKLTSMEARETSFVSLISLVGIFASILVLVVELIVGKYYLLIVFMIKFTFAKLVDKFCATFKSTHKIFVW